MRPVLAFFCRTLLLAVYVVLGRYEHEATPLNVVERAVVTCMQACLLGAGWVLYELCALVVRVLSRSAYTHVGAGDPDDLEPGRRRAADKGDADATSVVTFASRLALGRYIAKVHVIGVVVWTTMLSIDYALSQASFVFVLGMLLGNVAAVLTSRSPHPGTPLAVVAVYWSLTGALVLLYLVRDGASALVATEAELGMTPSRLEWSQVFMAVAVLLSPGSCGFSWTFWMDARTLLAHYRTSLYTCIILSVPVLILVRDTYLPDILARYSAPWLAHVLVTEPLLKFMTIYTMTLSLDAEDVVEMLTVNTSVVGACYVAFEPHDVAFDAAVAVLIALLLALHAVRLTRRALRTRRQPQFCITEDEDTHAEDTQHTHAARPTLTHTQHEAL